MSRSSTIAVWSSLSTALIYSLRRKRHLLLDKQFYYPAATFFLP